MGNASVGLSHGCTRQRIKLKWVSHIVYTGYCVCWRRALPTNSKESAHILGTQLGTEHISSIVVWRSVIASLSLSIFLKGRLIHYSVAAMLNNRSGGESVGRQMRLKKERHRQIFALHCLRLPISCKILESEPELLHVPSNIFILSHLRPYTNLDPLFRSQYRSISMMEK